MLDSIAVIRNTFLVGMLVSNCVMATHLLGIDIPRIVDSHLSIGSFIVGGIAGIWYVVLRVEKADGVN